jgi:hypothetical protein
MTEGYSIELFLRHRINRKILKYLEKRKCDVCGTKENLHIHHMEEFMFVYMLYKSLDDLTIEYKRNYTDYTEDELVKLEIMLLGWHLYGDFKILCENCHIETHNKIKRSKQYVAYKFLQKYKWQYNHYKEKFPDCTLEDFFWNFNKFYIEELLTMYAGRKIFLYSYDFEEFHNAMKNNLIKEHFCKTQDKTIKRRVNIVSMGINVINKIFQNYKIEYKIFSEQCHKKPNRYKTCWIILPINNEEK